MKPDYYLFGDGSSSRTQDIGAWTSVAIAGENVSRQLLYGIDFPTTISRCELRPIIEGLRWIKHNWHPDRTSIIRVHSDSEYTIRTLSGEYPRKKNEDLWAAVDEAARGLTVQYRWRERNSTPYMEFCDSVCGPFRRMMIDNMSKIAKDPRQPEQDMPMLALPEET